MYPTSEAHADSPPFKVERVSQDYFDLIIKIRFRPEFQQSEATLIHCLRFKPDGLKRSILFEIDPPKAKESEQEGDKKFVKALAAYIQSKG